MTIFIIITTMDKITFGTNLDRYGLILIFHESKVITVYIGYSQYRYLSIKRSQSSKLFTRINIDQN